mmetsp:Transcript_35974/g.70707  ORF Transcript_35974/g.70707 Transcript_35974/m.70707 type:complete len:333 (+) Transcript_35974:100-1098(+)
MPPKKGGKGATEDPSPEPEEEPEVEVVPPDPFDRYDEVWVATNLEDQRKLVCEIWDIQDGPSHSLQAISLDIFFHHLLFANEQGMNSAAAKKFCEIMEGLQEGLKSEDTDMPQAFAVFKQTLMDNSVLLALPPKEEEKPPEPEPVVEERTSSSRNSKRAPAKPKSSKGAPPPEEVADEKVVEEEPKKPLLDPRFSVEQIKHATEYAKAGIFSHYNLHRAVFNLEAFVPRKHVQSASVQVRAAIPDGLKLMDAVDVDEEEAMLEEERRKEEEEERQRALADAVELGVDVDPDSEVGKLVEQYLRDARDQMRVLVAANAKTLDGRFQEVCGKLK